MDFKLGEREELLRKSTREFAESEITPRIEAMEETGEFPVDLLKPMAKLGITALNDFGTEAQKKKYIPPLSRGETMGCVAVTEPSGGSDVLGMQSTAALKGDKYILNGRKCWITNSHTSDYWIVIARTGEGPKGLSAFIVDKDAPGAKPGRKEHKFGLRGANTGELVMDNCEIPKDNLLGQEGGGLGVALKTVSESGRTGMAAVALGILQACYEEAAKYASERVLYGKPIAALPAITFYVGEIYTQLDICRLLCYRASWMKDQNMRFAQESATAKSYTCEAAAQCAKKAIEIHGANGIAMEYKVQRLLRDALVTISSGGPGGIGKGGGGRAG